MQTLTIRMREGNSLLDNFIQAEVKEDKLAETQALIHRTLRSKTQSFHIPVLTHSLRQGPGVSVNFVPHTVLENQIVFKRGFQFGSVRGAGTSWT